LSNASTTLTTNNGFNQYAWSNGSNSQSISITNNGTYTVTVTDANGCTGSATIATTTYPLPNVSISGNNSICSGLSATFSVPNTFVSYDWSSGETTPSITANVAGSYTVTVTNANNCTATAATTLTINPNPIPNITAPISFCSGDVISIDADAGYTQYIWSTGATTQTINTPFSGNYAVTVTNSNGCTGNAQVSVAETILSPSITGPTSICGGSSATLSATPGYTTYHWAAGESTASINATTDDTYAVTVTDANGCTGSASFVLSVPPPPTVSISGNIPVCAGQNVTLNAGAGFTTYQWSNGGVTQTNTVTTSNTYTVTVTDANACSTTASTTVTVNAPPSASANNNSPTCLGGVVNLTASGGTSYVWSGTGITTPNQQNQTVTASAAGSFTYVVTVTDANACSTTASTTVTVNAPPSAAANNNSPTCLGGVVNLTASGGTSYVWSGAGITTPNQQNQTLTPSTAGSFTYVVTVTDANGCTSTASTTVTVNAPPSVAANNNSPTCLGGVVNLTASGGTSYVWSGAGITTPNQQNQTVTVSAAGSFTYVVTVTDANGCSTTASTTVTVNAPPSASANNNSPTCLGGTVNLTASGGTSYVWSGAGITTPNQQNQTVTASAAGSFTYVVTVTDANGCSSTASTTITVNAPPSASANNNSPTCLGGAVNLTSSGGTSYVWSGADITTPNQQNQTVTALAAGSFTYVVTVTDANGCSSTASTTVTVNAPPSASANNNSPTCLGGAVNLTASGGTSYVWSGTGITTPNQQNQTVTALAAGSFTYVVTVTDANACSSTASTTVTVNAPPSASANNNSPTCLGGAVNLTSSGGTSYVWSGTGISTPNQQNQTVTASAAGSFTYVVTVTDANACSTTASTTVTVNAPPSASANNNSPTCLGGVVNLTASGGTSYVWSGAGITTPNQQNQTVTASAAGSFTYVVTVTDANGCSSTASTTITVNAPPSAAANNNSPTCLGGAVNLTSSGGTSYVWSGAGITTPNQQNQTLTPSTAGSFIYVVTVTDANGCSSTASTTVTVNAPPAPIINGGGAICSGANVTLSTATTYNTYVWSGNSSTSQTATYNNVTTPTTYTVTVTDSNNCIATVSTIVTISPLPTATISGTTSICSGNTANITFNGTPNSVITYNINGGNNQTIVLTGGTVSIPTGVLSANTTYNLVSVTDGTCSQAQGGSANITVSNLPTLNVVTACGAGVGTGSVTTTATAGAGGTLSYTLNPNFSKT
jgi:hypothetical protein